MEKSTTAEKTQGATPQTETKYQFTLKEVAELANEPKVLQVMVNLSNNEAYKGKTGQYLKQVAEAVLKQMELM